MSYEKQIKEKYHNKGNHADVVYLCDAVKIAQQADKREAELEGCITDLKNIVSLGDEAMKHAKNAIDLDAKIIKGLEERIIQLQSVIIVLRAEKPPNPC